MQSITEWPPKLPDEVVRYGIDFAAKLDDGETLTAVTWSATGVTVTGDGTSGTFAYALVSGGTLGAALVVTATATTSGGQTLKGEIKLEIRRR